MATSIGRGLLLALLVLAMGGFGICSLCGGVMGLSMLGESSRGSRDIAWFAFGCSAVDIVITWLCWRGFRALRKPFDNE